MNDEQFERELQFLSTLASPPLIEQIRARDTAQREALARVEAERDTAIVQMQNIRTNRDRLNKQLGDAEFKLCISQQQLTEAVGLIEKSADLAGELGDYLVSLEKPHSSTELLDHERNLRAFLDRHAQAEQQESRGPMAKVAEGLRQKAADEWASHPSNTANEEAQGAQVGEFQREERYIVIKRKDLEKAPALMAYALQVALDGLREHLPERECLVIEGDWPEFEPTWAAIQARVEGRDALATQPAAGEPIHQWADQDLWMDGDEADMASARAEGFKTRTLWTAPPAAAHGDEAVRKDATESAIQRACRELPEGWSLQIELERGAGDVTLFNAWDIVVDFGQDFESSISEQVDAAIDAAMRAQGDGGEA